MMKGIVCDRYGSPDVLKLLNVPKPTPKSDQVLIKVKSTSINAGDYHLLSGEPWVIRLIMGFFKPSCPILGADCAGIVESVGSTVRDFKVGDEVCAILSQSGFGGFAEYVCCPEELVVLKPASITFAQGAASGSAAATALQGLRNEGRLREPVGKKVLITGASGGVGSFAVQIAKALGANVTATCGTRNVQLVQSLGADTVLDYTKEDVTKLGQHFDLIFDAACYRDVNEYDAILVPGTGRYVFVGGEMSRLTQVIQKSLFSSNGRQYSMFSVKPSKEDLQFMMDLVESKRVVPVIETVLKLEHTALGVRSLQEKHTRGKIVIEF